MNQSVMNALYGGQKRGRNAPVALQSPLTGPGSQLSMSRNRSASMGAALF